MYIIEFIAPAASGKTTICDELIKNKKNRFISQNAISALKFLPISLVRLLQVLSKYKFISFLIFKIFNLFHKLDVAYLKYFLSEKETSRCIEIYFSNICSSFKNQENIQKASDRLSFFISSATSFNLIKLYEKNATGILDEGFAQRGISLIYHGISASTVREYYQNTPLPNLLVVLKIDNENVVKRLNKRNNDKAWFFDYIDESIQSVDDCKQIYQKRGCNVLELDTRDSLEKNIKIILERLKNDK
ncbi:hypothetical protein N8724_06320 [Candidatus Pelagibacter sp.]|nr:hypothetical protein [Candidatus Pelagibacter sp.]